MARQLITLEIEYDPVSGEDNPTLRAEPKDWGIEGILDHFDDCTEPEQGWETNTIGVRILHAREVEYSDVDRERAKELGTTLFAMGVLE